MDADEPICTSVECVNASLATTSGDLLPLPPELLPGVRRPSGDLECLGGDTGGFLITMSAQE